MRNFKELRDFIKNHNELFYRKDGHKGTPFMNGCYLIKDSKYLMEFSVNKIKIYEYDENVSDYHKAFIECSFDDVLSKLPKEVKKIILYNMDLFV